MNLEALLVIGVFTILLGGELYFLGMFFARILQRDPAVKKLNKNIAAKDLISTFVIVILGIYFLLPSRPKEPISSARPATAQPPLPIENAQPKEVTRESSHVYKDGEPIDIVRRSPCKQGGTIDEYFTKKNAIPAVTDLGWTMRDTNDGFLVEKEIHILGFRSSTVYRWHVSVFGNIKPVNGHALGVSPP
jgi:hypothetical protein